MTVKIQLRHDTAANWELVKNTVVLFKGELGFVIDGDSTRFKVGDGVSTWAELPFYDTKIVQHITELPNTVTFDRGVVVTENLIVEGSTASTPYNIDGTAKQAYKDNLGNQISTYYQKNLIRTDLVEDNTDWNSKQEEGIYAVRCSNAFVIGNVKNQPVGAEITGILVVHHDALDQIVQMYIQDTTTIVSRFCDTGSHWSAWKSISEGDPAVVHTSGNETIGGEKTFTDEIKSTNGTLTFNNDTVNIKKGNTTLLGQDSLGNITLGGLNITGDVISGSCTKDGQGNVISDTYLVKGSAYTPIYNLKTPARMYSSECPEEYERLIEMKYSTFDLSKYTVVGTPTIDTNVMITSDSYNYVQTSTFSVGNDEFRIGFKFEIGANPVDVYLFNTNVSTSMTDLAIYLGPSKNIVAYSGGQSVCSIASNAYETGETISEGGTTYVVPAIYRGYFERKLKTIGGVQRYVYTLWYKRLNSSASGEEIHFVENESGDAIYPITTTKLDIAPNNSTGAMAVHLNYFSVIVNGTEVFYGREKGSDIIDNDITIPYSYTNDGVKIADGDVVNDLVEMYESYGTANYFVLNDVIETENQWFQFPYGNATGHCYKLYYWHSGSSAMCEYDTDMVCTQMAQVTNGTAYTFHKKFADSTYALLGVTYSSKTNTGFTPTSDGYFIAKGRITLEPDS